MNNSNLFAHSRAHGSSMARSTNQQTQYQQNQQNQQQTSYGHAPAMPMPDTDNYPMSTNQVYSGMTFCPGIDKAPVVRFLPPKSQTCNFMSPSYKGGIGPTSKANCPRCGQPRNAHQEGGDWTKCPNPCFCHGAPLNGTILCPYLYSSTTKMNRVFRWPNNAHLPAYMTIFPTEEQQKHLIQAGYMEGPPHPSNIPIFTRQAYDLIPELDLLDQWDLARPGYDLTVMSKVFNPKPVAPARGFKRPHESISDPDAQSSIPPSLRNRSTPNVLPSPFQRQNIPPSPFQPTFSVGQNQSNPFAQPVPPALPGAHNRPSDLPPVTTVRPVGETSDTGHISRRQRIIHNDAVQQNNPAAMAEKIKQLEERLRLAQDELRLYRDDFKRRGITPPPRPGSLASRVTRDPSPNHSVYSNNQRGNRRSSRSNRPGAHIPAYGDPDLDMQESQTQSDHAHPNNGQDDDFDNMRPDIDDAYQEDENFDNMRPDE